MEKKERGREEEKGRDGGKKGRDRRRERGGQKKRGRKIDCPKIDIGDHHSFNHLQPEGKNQV